MNPELIGIITTAIALATLIIGLVTWLRADLNKNNEQLRADLKELRADLNKNNEQLRTDMKELRADLNQHGQRLARVEATLELILRLFHIQATPPQPGPGHHEEAA